MESVEAPRVDPGFGEEGLLSSLSLGRGPGGRGRRKEQDEQMSTMSYGAA